MSRRETEQERGRGRGKEERGEWGSLHQEVRVAVPEVCQLNRNPSQHPGGE